MSGGFQCYHLTIFLNTLGLIRLGSQIEVNNIGNLASYIDRVP